MCTKKVGAFKNAGRGRGPKTNQRSDDQWSKYGGRIKSRTPILDARRLNFVFAPVAHLMYSSKGQRSTPVAHLKNEGQRSRVWCMAHLKKEGQAAHQSD